LFDQTDYADVCSAKVLGFLLLKLDIMPGFLLISVKLIANATRARKIIKTKHVLFGIKY